MKSSFIPGILIATLSIVCIAFIFYGLKKGINKTHWTKQKQSKIFNISIVSVLCWAVLLAVVSLNGFIKNFNAVPPRLALIIFIPLPFILIAAFSNNFKELLTVIPPKWLVLAQSFRVLVELILIVGFLRRIIPVQMTFEGRNFDVITGLLALPVGYFCFVKKTWGPKIAVGFNIIGLLLLANILVIAILSTPSSFRYFMNEPANTIVAEFPFVYLPGALVVIAYSLHIFSLRQLSLLKRNK